jgi:hypothetical protein
MNLDNVSQDFIRQLTDNFLAQVIEQVHAQALSAVQEQLDTVDILELVKQEINNSVLPSLTQEVQDRLKTLVTEQICQIDVNSLVAQKITDSVLPAVAAHGRDYMGREIVNTLSALNAADLVRQQTASMLHETVRNASFPERSIPGTAINSAGLSFAGDNYTGGILKNFESTGIQDRASDCQVTILDNATVFENRLVAAGLEIAGPATFRGEVRIEGHIPDDSPFARRIADTVSARFSQQYSDGNFDNYCERTIGLIQDQGLSSTYIKLENGSAVVEGRKLSDHVTESNLQTVGALKSLQVIGETYLDDTVYVNNKRVGINTLEPERTLDIWDHEIQIIAGKKMQDTAVFGTIRNQNLVLTANNKDQLTLNIDGSVTVKTLNIGKTVHVSSNRRPTDNRATGTIVWNENPVIGAPVGWVSLGGARWSPFGTITG